MYREEIIVYWLLPTYQPLLLGAVSFNPNYAEGLHSAYPRNGFFSLGLIEMIKITVILIFCIKFPSS